ncbi:hypothetical protein SLUN_20145 [Streptomyces lunaelactis]|uniref:Uncharacterized protein n=1 Tax=Streptomyces lunaelactis TaxID=1535768 RepID=A0A2R4TEK3_9ACTN|nr:hypothetical protein SLUN_20145 [Streptomyces lunaelactis]
MGEVDLRHATTAEHRAQFVPAAEATRLFHNCSSPLRQSRPHPCVVRRCAVRAYATGHAAPDPPVTVT